MFAEPDDMALIYFAGHAFLDERSGDSYLALSNTQYQNPATALRLPTLLQQILGRSRAAHILVILDCFQNGARWQMQRTSPYDSLPLINAAAGRQADRLLLCSCRGNEAAPEAGERNLGLFMHRVIVGLCGAASDPATGLISAQGLYTYLSSVTGEQQRPLIVGQQRTPMILIGDTEALLPQQVTPSANPPMRSGNGLFKQPMGRTATATVPFSPPPAEPMAAPVETPQQQQDQSLLSQAQQMVMAQNYGEALSLVDQILQRQPQEGSALVLKAQLLGTLGRFPEALLVVDQLTQLNPNNALAWSMRAVLLSNMQQFPDALTAVDRSLVLDPQNAETSAIKSNILAAMEAVQGQGARQGNGQEVAGETKGGTGSFLLGTGLQVLGLVLGIVGVLLPALLSRLPVAVGFVLAGLGLSLLCVCAARGTYRYGWTRLIPTFLLSIIAAGIIVFGGLLNLVISTHTPTNARLLNLLDMHPSFVVPIVVLGAWLIAAIIVPPLLAILGLVSGLVVRQRKQRG
jgi:Tetratricopeptide repeat